MFTHLEPISTLIPKIKKKNPLRMDNSPISSNSLKRSLKVFLKIFGSQSQVSLHPPLASSIFFIELISLQRLSLYFLMNLKEDLYKIRSITRYSELMLMELIIFT